MAGRVVLGSDHAGFALRKAIARHVAGQGRDTYEVGAEDESPYDYPDAGFLVAEEVASGRAETGILVCGTGIGVCIAANRNPNVRGAVCWSTESAKLAREHNGANVLCLGSRLLSEGQAIEIADVFLQTSEDVSDRHVRRRRKLEGPGALA